MTQIKRMATGEETLEIHECPCCGGEVNVRDCGYSSFNPGFAECRGACKRRWLLGNVRDQWESGLKWNSMSNHIKKRLQTFSLIQVDRQFSISRDYYREDMEEEAIKLLAELKEIVIGAQMKLTARTKK